MRRQQHCHAILVAQLLQQIAQFTPHARIKPRARLVQQEQLRPMQQALGNLDTPAQPARERLDEVARAISQPETPEHFVDAPMQCCAAQIVQVTLMTEIFRDGQFLVETRRLKYNTESSTDFQAVNDDVAVE